ncbi:mucin-2 isoform X1 [Episyrphus balteatus]|uniref:mucin-2 isoform X1 n=1 Tax=Episyrphus balteatus TaxID=286459 RepID=UPI00248658EA|nr:mucin-2 isoform X1 [Episyrphus balteatus]
MQNIGAPKSLEPNLNAASSEVELRSEQPLLRKTLSDNFCKSLDEDEEQLDTVVDLANKQQPTVVPIEQLSPKSKTRSRFTSAFRSFRASKSTKKKIPTPTSSSDQVLSSGGEDLEVPQSDSNDSKKKKSKLSKKFSLTGIKKNKVNPKKEEEILSSNLLLVTSSTQTTQTLDRRPIFTADNETKRKVTVTTSSDHTTPPYSLSPESSPTKFDKVRKIQITIQGKKIEHTNKNNNNNNNGIQGRKNLPTTTTEIVGSTPTTPNTDEGDYLIATTTTEESKQQQKPLISTSPSKKNSKKNKKPKSKPNSPPNSSPSASPSGNKSITSTISTTTTTEDKLIVTQSICDTPPRERAPAKPSRAPFTTAQSFASAPTGAIRKSLSHQLPRLRRQRFHAFDSVDSESYFMIREGTVERGRRFPRPASIDIQDLSPSSPPIITQLPKLPIPLGITTTENPKLPPQSSIDDHEPQVKSLPPFVEETSNTTEEPHETINQKQRKIVISLPSFVSSIGSELDDVDNRISDISSPDVSPIHYYVGNNLLDTEKPNLSDIISKEENSIEDISIVQETHESAHQRKIISLPSFASTSSLERESITTDQDNINSAQTDDASLYFSGNNLQNPNLRGLSEDQSLEDGNDDGTREETPIICDHRHNIRFAVGTSVRPQRTVIPLSQFVLDSKDFSSFESANSFDSGGRRSPITDINKRRLQYINQQATIYSNEDTDNVDGNVGGGTGSGSGGSGSGGSVRKESLNYISGISEYSFESEFSPPEPSMPAFGDLTMDQENPPIMTSSQEKREHLYKILVIGELGTGKTSFIKRYVHQFFSQNYRATIGVDFALKVLNWDSNTIVRLQLWDIAGQERFGNMTRVYYKEAVGAFIVFDVTRSGTFDCVSKWKEDLDSKVQLPDGSPIPCILLANKCDQDKQGIITTPEKMDEYVRENGFAGWFETSAKENINIDEAARALVNKILLNDKLISDADIADSEKFNLANSNGGQTTTQAIKSKCSC